jgi:hypothetical protein
MEYQYGSDYEEWARQARAEREAQEARYAELQPNLDIVQGLGQKALTNGKTHHPVPGQIALTIAREAQIAARQDVPEQRA